MKKKRTARAHGLSAAGAGDAGNVADVRPLGPCPGCGANLHVGSAWDPVTSRQQPALLHAMPFCTYFGETEPEVIHEEVRRRGAS